MFRWSTDGRSHIKQSGILRTNTADIPATPAPESLDKSFPKSSSPDPLASWYMTNLQALQEIHTLPQALSRLCLLSGGRISEMLDLQGKDLTEEGFILLRPKKHSRYKLLHDDVSCIYLQHSVVSKRALLFPYSYGQACRVLRDTLSTPPPLPKKRYNTKAHITRYAYIAYMSYSYKLELEEISDIVGHKARKSTEGYIRRLNNG